MSFVKVIERSYSNWGSSKDLGSTTKFFDHEEILNFFVDVYTVCQALIWNDIVCAFFLIIKKCWQTSYLSKSGVCICPQKIKLRD